MSDVKTCQYCGNCLEFDEEDGSICIECDWENNHVDQDVPRTNRISQALQEELNRIQTNANVVTSDNLPPDTYRDDAGILRYVESGFRV